MVEIAIENAIYFLIGMKTLEISAYVYNRIFTKYVNNDNFKTLRQIFLQLRQLSLRAL